MVDDAQSRHLVRVATRIANLVHAWCVLRQPRPRGDGREFTADELLAFVHQQLTLDGQGATVRPGSPDRIMRDLRQRGVLDVENTNRAAGTYRVRLVRPLDYQRPVAPPTQLRLDDVG